MDIYYCTKENNICEKRETCMRYLESKDKNKTTLFKQMCTNENNYILYVKQGEDI